MRILVLSNTAWSSDNSFGLSYSNIFHGIPDLQFANIYCNTGTPDNEFQMECFQITTKMLLNNLKDSKSPSGHVVLNNSGSGATMTKAEQQQFDAARKLRWQILFWWRDLIWKIGRWKSPDLKKFIDDFQPDIIFQPVYFSSYLNDIAQFIKRYTNVPMVGYISDDNYTLRQFRLSPLYWIDRLWKRQKVKKTINMCEILYVISDIQKEEYEKIFNPPCKVLTKCAEFDGAAPTWPRPKTPIKMLYAGNISSGRYASLKMIADALQKINKQEVEVELHIYTLSPLWEKQKAVFSKNGCYLHNAVPYTELIALQKSADVLIHVEGLSLKERLNVHQSFSTKLVDYFELGKCILAVGPNDVASIKHLIDKEAAVVAQTEKEVYNGICNLISNPDCIEQYGRKAYECGMKNHRRTMMQTMIIEDLKRLAGNFENVCSRSR